MNILFLDQFSDLGGAQRCLLDLLPAVRERGWRAHIAAPGEGRLVALATDLGAEFHPIRCGPYESGRKSAADIVRVVREMPALAREIKRLAGESRADILYVNGPRLLPAASITRLPMVFHCHSYLGKRYAAALAGMASSNARVIGSCRFVLEPLQPFAGGGHMEVVYNGVQWGGPPGPRPTPSSASMCTEEKPAGGPAADQGVRPTRIGVIGRIAPEKGQLTLVEAARLLPGSYRFIICGAPLFADPAAAHYFERVREAARGLPFEFLGWRDDAGAVLSQLDLLVVPSEPGEATTRVILEAYAAGVPVIASCSGGIP